MNAQSVNVGDPGGLGIFRLLAEGLAVATRSADTFEGADLAPPKAPRSLADRIDAWFWRDQQRAVEKRLARATDIFELERMICALERGNITLYD